jgi:hypothetical protein
MKRVLLIMKKANLSVYCEAAVINILSPMKSHAEMSWRHALFQIHINISKEQGQSILKVRVFLRC